MVRHRMSYIGYEPARETLKYRCPAKHEGWECPMAKICNAGKSYGMTVRVPREIDLRRFPSLPRATKKFERLYRGRTAVERLNARLKVFWGADDGNVHRIAAFLRAPGRGDGGACGLRGAAGVRAALGRNLESDEARSDRGGAARPAERKEGRRPTATPSVHVSTERAATNVHVLRVAAPRRWRLGFLNASGLGAAPSCAGAWPILRDLCADCAHPNLTSQRLPQHVPPDASRATTQPARLHACRSWRPAGT